jgi:hypothetical protein
MLSKEENEVEKEEGGGEEKEEQEERRRIKRVMRKIHFFRERETKIGKGQGRRKYTALKISKLCALDILFGIDRNKVQIL